MKKLLFAALLLPLLWLASCSSQGQEVGNDPVRVTSRSAGDIWDRMGELCQNQTKQQYPANVPDKADEARFRAMYASALGRTLADRQHRDWELMSAFYFGWAALCDFNLAQTRAPGTEVLSADVEAALAQTGIDLAGLQMSISAAAPEDLLQDGYYYVKELHDRVASLTSTLGDDMYMLDAELRLLYLEILLRNNRAAYNAAVSDIQSVGALIDAVLATSNTDRGKPYNPCFNYKDGTIFFSSYQFGTVERDFADLLNDFFPVAAASHDSEVALSLLNSFCRENFDTTDMDTEDFHAVMTGFYSCIAFAQNFVSPDQKQFSAVASPATISAAGGVNAINITTNTEWRLQSLSAGLTATGATSGNNANVTFTYRADPNENISQRDHEVVFLYSSLGGVPDTQYRVAITQNGVAPIPFTATAVNQTVTGNATTNSIAITTTTDWMVRTLPAGITASSAIEGTGNGTFRFKVAQNPTLNPRTFTITFVYSKYGQGLSDEYTVTFTQEGLKTFNVLEEYNYDNKYARRAHISANPNFSNKTWTLVSPGVAWCSVTKITPTTSTTPRIQVLLSENNTGAPRTCRVGLRYTDGTGGTMYFNIVQSASNGGYYATPSPLNVGYDGGNYTITVQGDGFIGSGFPALSRYVLAVEILSPMYWVLRVDNITQNRILLYSGSQMQGSAARQAALTIKIRESMQESGLEPNEFWFYHSVSQPKRP